MRSSTNSTGELLRPDLLLHASGDGLAVSIRHFWSITSFAGPEDRQGALSDVELSLVTKGAVRARIELRLSVNLVHMAYALDSNLSSLGYEGLTAETFVRRLKNRGVEVVVDVRMSPISRKKGLSKSALRSLLELNGIDYLHLRALGNPKENRAGYAQRVGTAAVQARNQFRELLKSDDAQAALADLNRLAESRSVAVICYECDEENCHREQVLEAVRGRALVSA